MRLQKFVNEDIQSTYNSLVDDINKNCQQYIKEINSGNGRIFTRYTKQRVGLYYKQSTEEELQPLWKT